MGQIYQQITIEERCESPQPHASGYSLRQTVTTLGRSTSIISRESDRNSSVPRATGPSMPSNRPAPATGPTPSWSVTTPCATGFCPACNKAGLQSRLLAVWAGLLGGPSSPTSQSTISSMTNWPARRTTPGVTSSLDPSPNEAAKDVKAAGPLLSSTCAVLKTSVPARPLTAPPQVILGAIPDALRRTAPRGQSLLLLSKRHSRLLMALLQLHKGAVPIAKPMSGYSPASLPSGAGR